MDQDVRKVLDDLDNTLMGLNIQKRSAVLQVLSALRGPDEANKSNLKQTTTVQIREAALPQVFHRTGENTFLDVNTYQTAFQEPRMGWGVSNHFEIHVNDAARALCLTSRSLSGSPTSS